MAEVLETLQTNIVVETSSDAKMDVDVITDVAVKNLLGEMLSDIEAGNGEQIDKEFQASKSMNSAGSTTSLVSEGKIKLEKEDKMAAADSKRREVQPPDPNGKSEPIVIDLSDDEEEYSKENIEKTPVKSLNGLVKSLTTDKSDELIAKIKMAVSKLPRDVLEDMYCAKICENIELDTSVRKLEQKVLSFNLYKDRMTSKAQGLQGQVVDSARAMGVVTDLLTRNPKNVQKASNPTPLKFQRTVGIQCRNDPLPRLKGPPLTNSKLMNTPPPPLAIPNGNGKKVVSPGITPHKNGVIQPAAAPVTQQTVLKRQKQTISVDDVRDQVQSEVPPKVARRPGPASAMRAYQQAAAANPSDSGVSPLSNGNSVSPNSGSSKALVDLTSQTQNKGNVVVNQNGVQYRVVNSAMPQGVQIVTSTAGTGPYQLVTNGQQGRPILVQQQPVRPMNSGQPLVIRPSPQNSQNIIIRTSGSPTRMSLGQGQRPVISVTNNTRQVSPRGNSPATLNNVVARTQAPPNNGFATYPKFILPELPQMSSQPKKPKDPPPRPTLTLQEQGGGIVLSWTHISSAIYAEIQSYQIFACQEPIMNGPINGKVYPTPQWKRVGDVKALPLPMACTLSQFTEENRYHFIVRGVDVYNRTGLFCEIVNILLKKRK